MTYLLPLTSPAAATWSPRRGIRIFPDTDFNRPLVGTNVDPAGYPLENTLGVDLIQWF